VPPLIPRLSLLLPLTACAASGPGPVVTAPALVQAAPAPRASAPRHGEMLAACALPWTLEDVEGGAGRVVAVCGGDVRRLDLEAGPMTRSIEAVLEPGRARVCACAARMAAPPYLDLVVTTSPDEGTATLEPGETDEEQDAELTAPFVACVGTVKASFPRSHADTCGQDRAVFKYPLRVELSK
jgi:hypothetical protein